MEVVVVLVVVVTVEARQVALTLPAVVDILVYLRVQYHKQMLC